MMSSDVSPVNNSDSDSDFVDVDIISIGTANQILIILIIKTSVGGIMQNLKQGLDHNGAV